MTVTAHQLLHGYSDGHRLLASSTNLPPGLQRALLIHSDAPPGPDGQRSLSSLPLPSDGLWALTATWRAEEMPRPGSVWSHTILLDSNVVAAVRQAGGLLRALRRPKGPSDVAAYRAPVDLEPVGPITSRSPTAGPLLEALLAALYGWPETASVISSRLADAEFDLLAVWEQQWPELRMNTAFATRQRLDPDGVRTVQVASSRQRGRPATPVIDAETVDVPRLPRWVRQLADDVRHPGRLRLFLARYGPDAPGGRTAMPGLVDIHNSLRAPDADPLAAIAAIAPEPDQLARLKHDALRPGSDLWTVPEGERLLAVVGHHRLVDWRGMSLARRCAEQTADADLALALLQTAGSSENPALVEEVTDAIARAARVETLAALAERDETIAAVVASRRPDLLADPQLWEREGAWQENLLATLTDDQIAAAGLGRSRIETGRHRLAARLRRNGLLDSRELARAIAAEGISTGSWQAYKTVFGDAKRQAIDHAMRADASWTERLLAALLAGARSPLIIEHGPQLARRLHELDEEQQIELAIRLLTARPKGPVPREVMHGAFPVLHRALVEQQLTAKQWARLDKVLPAGNNWDHAERLRKALLESIRTDDWSEREIADVVNRAGPKAEKLRELTTKKSNLRNLVDAAFDLLTPW